MKRSMWVWLGLLAAGLVVAAGVVVRQRGAGPRLASAEYERTVVHFTRGLAELEVGLLDRAVESFAAATATAPAEPATWADLALARLRLGDVDAARPALERASALAADSAAVAFLQSRLESMSGRADEGIAALRKAVALDTKNLVSRMALAQAVEDAGSADADREAQQLLDELATLAPGNPAILIERARVAAKRGDAAAVRSALNGLAAFSRGGPAEVSQQFATVQTAVDGSDMAAAARELAFLRNTLGAVPEFREARRMVAPAPELVANPLTTFLRLPLPSSQPDPADAGLTFSREALATSVPATTVVATSPDGNRTPVLWTGGSAGVAQLGVAQSVVATSPVATIAALDWNNDFRVDLAGAGESGVSLWLQSEDGRLVGDTPRLVGEPMPKAAVTGLWPADIEMDGDLDLVVGVAGEPAYVLRNNADGTWQVIRPFGTPVGARAFAWGDIDADGDPDAVIADGSGALHVWRNLQAGRFALVAGPPAAKDVRAVAIADVDSDGRLDVVWNDASSVRAAALSRADSAAWDDRLIAATPAAADARARVFAEDLDNNGAIDVVLSSAGTTSIWLGDADHSWTAFREVLSVDAQDIVDLNDDGWLDLAGIGADGVVRLLGKGTRGYHFQVVRPRAQSAKGDQRINAFGLGGDIEVRAGRLTQRQTIRTPVVHVGLGSRTAVQVTRIVWPNGVLQADFDTPGDGAVVAEQRLKGSCPWVFADAGSGPQFVTDFLWRSPLGLRINAVDTAGVTQTEDWVRIRGDQLKPKDGVYDVRITAELWETHFIDHTSLLVVDHPADVHVAVDERFARQAPALAVRAMAPPVPVVQARDESGRDVTALVQARDGRYLDTFARGAYQGVAVDHYVDVDLPTPISTRERTWLVAEGWIYPTDSSINVAIGQGRAVAPRGLSLEAQRADGVWIVVEPDLGFPAGKSKTILVDLSAVTRKGLADVRRLRLRTNLEIYWDALAVAVDRSTADLRTSRLAAAGADLRYRGFSQSDPHERTSPEIPRYDRLANRAPRWRDLTGFYTRFGDVRELLQTVDDRYVIMNAGDELRLTFTAPAPPPAGWTRDFVLIGDGWEKDGDYNTTASTTVLPLPRHGHPEYPSPSAEPSLSADPVYQQHREDWRTYHTRFVAPDRWLGREP